MTFPVLQIRFLQTTLVLLPCILVSPQSAPAQNFDWYKDLYTYGLMADSSGLIVLGYDRDGANIIPGILARRYSPEGDSTWTLKLPEFLHPHDKTTTYHEHSIRGVVAPDGERFIIRSLTYRREVETFHDVVLRYHLSSDGRITAVDTSTLLDLVNTPDNRGDFAGVNTYRTPGSLTLMRWQGSGHEVDSATINIDSTLSRFRGNLALQDYISHDGLFYLLFADALTYESALIIGSAQTGIVKTIALDETRTTGFAVMIRKDGTVIVLASEVSWDPRSPIKMKIVALTEAGDPGRVTYIDAHPSSVYGGNLLGETSKGELVASWIDDGISTVFIIEEGKGLEAVARLFLYNSINLQEGVVGPGDELYVWSRMGRIGRLNTDRLVSGVEQKEESPNADRPLLNLQ